MAAVVAISLSIAGGVLVLLAVAAALFIRRHQQVRRRLRAAQRARTSRPRPPEALPPEPGVWDQPPAEGTVLVRSEEELRQLYNVVRVVAVDDDVESTDVAETRQPSHLCSYNPSQNASLAYPQAGVGGDINSLHLLGASSMPTSRTSPNVSRSYDGGRRGAARATDVTISHDVAQPLVRPYPANIPLLSALKAPSPTQLELPAHVGSSDEKRTLPEPARGSPRSPENVTALTAASCPANHVPWTSSGPLLSRGATGAVTHIPQNAPMTIDHFGTPSMPEHHPTTNSVTAGRPLFSNPPAAPGLLTPAGDSDAHSLAAFPAHASLPVGGVAGGGGTREGNKSGASSFTLVGSVHPLANRQQAEQIVKRLLIPSLGDGHDSVGASGGYTPTHAAPDTHYAGLTAHYMPAGGDHGVRDAAPQGGRRESASLLFAPPRGPILGASTEKGDTVAPPQRSRSALASPDRRGWPLPPLHTSTATTSTLAVPNESGLPSGHSPNRHGAASHHGTSKLSHKRDGTSVQGKKNLKRLRHVHRGGFIMLEDASEPGEAEAKDHSRTTEAGTPEPADEATSSGTGATAGTDGKGSKAPVEAKRYYYEKLSSMEVYGRAAYGDPNADFLNSLPPS